MRGFIAAHEEISTPAQRNWGHQCAASRDCSRRKVARRKRSKERPDRTFHHTNRAFRLPTRPAAYRTTRSRHRCRPAGFSPPIASLM